MLELAGAAFVMGLIGSPHCVGMCGPFALACTGRSSHVLGWQAGKLMTYVGLGAIAGTVGASIPGPTWVPQLLSSFLILWFAAALAGFVREPTLRLPGVTRLATRTAGNDGLAARVVFGAVNGLLPCGLVYAAAGLAVAGGTAVGGALIMAAFGLGTAPALTTFAFSARSLFARRPAARRVLAVVVSIAGLWLVVRRGGLMPPMH